MLACSFCNSVPSPSWWTSPMPLAVVVLALGALVFGVIALDRLKGRGRTGAVLIMLGLVVVLPLASLAVREGRTSVDVATDPPPMDAPAWNVTCESALQASETDEAGALFADACRDATQGWRWTAIALGAASLGLVASGVVLVVRSRRPADIPADATTATV